MSDECKCQVYVYLKDRFIDVPIHEEDTSEDLCLQLCNQFGIGPLVQLLVGLRIHDERWFLPPCARPQPGKKYEFRVRFKIPKLSNLKTLDRALFNYYYYQLRHDLLQSKISEIEYDEYKNKILGYVVNDMYRKMVEDGVTVNDLKRTYDEYIPRKINKEHSLLFFNWARSKVFSSLNKICYKDHDVDYVKSVYIDDIDNIAPGYLYEEYSGSIPYPREDGMLKPGKCRVKVKFVPYCQRVPSGAKSGKNVQKDGGDSLPGLKVFYSREWRHIANIEEIFTILVEGLTVNISLKDQSNLYSIDFSSQTELDSFVTCLAGYYRLMCKWTVYLCKPYLYSPSLNRLTELKCHGPIGGKFSYSKIAEKNSSIGANIVRQCETHYDTYYVDILERENQRKTYKLTYGQSRWHVHREAGEVSTYDELLDALRNLNSDIKNLYRLSPTEHDKSPNLLLCLPESDMTSKRLLDAQEMRQIRPQIVTAAKELIINRNALKKESDQFFERTRAELLLPNNAKMEVTLRMLRNEKKDEFLSDFLQLADFWANIDSLDIIKLYGVTLFKPISMVLESYREGPLDEFLRRHPRVSFSSLIEVAHSLARALYYLQENGLVHGRLRCSSMLVTQYDRNENRLIAKLGDPGLRQQQQYTERDLLWIPLEYHELGPREVQLLKQDMKADVWACSTTLWEIFSRGRRLLVKNAKQFLAGGHRLGAPAECKDIKEIYQCMYNGWLVDPDKRFAPQMIISKLVQAKQKSNYCVIGHSTVNGTTNSTNGSYSKQSILSIETDSTLLQSRGDVSSSSYVSHSSDCDGGSNASSENSSHPLISNGGSTHYSAGSYSGGWGQSQAERFLYDCPDFIELPDGTKVIFQGELGQGHYGKVYRGCLDDGKYSKEVALKTINNFGNAMDMDKAVKDFKREVSIMKRLNHRNIVKFINFIDEPDKLVVVMEYVENGSLLDYLSYTTDLKKMNLLRFAKDIANGMNHLFEKKIIHRDLAARNILVHNINCVKISDFGLAQVTDGGNYYVAQSSRHLPIKWYAPETLCTQKYSFQSDVWSFGVTLYEMFTRGNTPYPNVEIRNGSQLFDLIVKDGIRLELRGDDRDVYDRLMAPCFNLNNQLRPTFQELLEKIEELINQYGESIQPL
ncbi:tyrosine-protein kinase hopscotch [Wyeomyia smithii]|uniref:tyrosine-protein kinase hopscotch n=1 Tax=Wyeomyia smithii TaxID=174621 RepID=UPI002467E311|nr:tyrosine-protein kinase hopscotch [Wyeomyia smithii]XP_055540142.1 tyrosine-protein kinase hopscotch [Wyeomyia smithii]XP_055540143.1 tyrosine-protein kinase hopscotch [Wyeomyia smithii]XP_055540144.1 tyrosine-protein kinase hopscotch [Wyeomyia smithii]XP_055540145.1 tyrosine-protein kinase hopscotch [Wyeomyia smithii]XP_055540147.1 tyrosine-protein kinase hopscotch [Wyeomyia smithii]